MEVTPTYKIGRIAKHFYEEPCISGKSGSGAVFFAGCTMKCCYCQNYRLSRGLIGQPYTEDELVDGMLRLQDEGALNINFVTPSPYAVYLPHIIERARIKGLKLPIVYNTSAYENVETIKKLNGLIDVYLPDFKYIDEEDGRLLSGVKDYPSIATRVIDEMVRQCPGHVFKEDKDPENGELMKKGVIVRHLILPERTKKSMRAIEYLHERYGEKIYISLMNQYTPFGDVARAKGLERPLTKREYEKVVNYAIDLGITKAYIQEGTTASESFIPTFS